MIRSHQQWCNQVTGNRFPPACLFPDVEGCLPPDTYNANESFRWKLYRVSNAPLMRQQHCLTHGRQCDLFPPAERPDLDCSGLPCWDFSLAGKRKRQEGATCTIFMAHAKRHKELRTPVLIIENAQARQLTIEISQGPGRGHLGLKPSISTGEPSFSLRHVVLQALSLSMIHLL